jgi:hypothetical protein
MAPTYQIGEKVNIIAGKYRNYQTATFVGLKGFASCEVNIRGDSKATRVIWLKSIEKKCSAGEDDGVNNAITVDKKELEDILVSLTNQKKTSCALESRIRALLDGNK